jgi:hypothetical protein
VASALPHAATLNSFLTLPFDAATVEACKEEPALAVTPLRGEGGKFAASRGEAAGPPDAGDGLKA